VCLFTCALQLPRLSCQVLRQHCNQSAGAVCNTPGQRELSTMTALSRDLQEYVVNVLQTSICVFHVQERASSMVPLHNSLQHVPPQGQPAAPTSLAFLCQLQGCRASGPASTKEYFGVRRTQPGPVWFATYSKWASPLLCGRTSCPHARRALQLSS
jgi:hypothetical protein